MAYQNNVHKVRVCIEHNVGHIRVIVKFITLSLYLVLLYVLLIN